MKLNVVRASFPFTAGWRPPERRRGFTLLELLLVLAILAILAGAALMVMGGTEDDASYSISRSEIKEIKKAFLHFKRDTGFLPKQGPFALVTDPVPGLVPVPAQGSAWFHSPANFTELYENPLAGTGHPLETWNPDTARGWRGPYLDRFGEGLVDVGDDLQSDGTGSPTSGAVLPEVRGIADPFVARPQGAYLVWRAISGDPPHPQWGRPYLQFDLDDESLARIVGMGKNKQYDGGAGDDILLELFR